MSAPPDLLPVREDGDVVRVRQAVRSLAAARGFGLVDQTKLVTAASEIARNTVIYGGGGQAELSIVEREGRVGLRLVFKDQGPGIADVNLAMKDGYTSGSGLGLGLPGAKRLVHDFEVTSAPGRGTTVTLVRWK